MYSNYKIVVKWDRILLWRVITNVLNVSTSRPYNLTPSTTVFSLSKAYTL